MALSDHEQDVLEALEDDLELTDPYLVSTLRLHAASDDPWLIARLIDLDDTLALRTEAEPTAVLAPSRRAMLLDERSEERTAPEEPADTSGPSLLVLDRDAAVAGLLLLAVGLLLLVGGLPLHPSLSVVGFAVMVLGGTRLSGAHAPAGLASR